MTALPKRFYQTSESRSEGDAHAILLDGKGVKTPAGRPLRIGHEGLAAAIVAEWAGQGERIEPATMPITRLANSVLDGIAPDPAATVEAVVGFFSSDLLCYRAEGPAELVERQATAWAPLLEWGRARAGIVLTVTTGIMHVAQAPDSLSAARRWASGLDPFTLGATHMAASVTGSGIIAMALAEGRLGSDAAWVASRIDEDWQIAQWGEDAEAAARAAVHRADLETAHRVFRILRDGAA